MTESEQERKNKRTALITTIGVNAIVLLLLFIVAAWRAPNPPNPEYGIELNFGTDDAGSGRVQPTEPVGTPETTAEETTEQESTTEETEENVPPAESTPVQEAEVQPEVTSKVESPVTVKEEKKVEPKPTEPEKKIETKPVEKKVEEKPVEKKPDPKPDPALDRLLNSKKGTQGSEGDDAGKTGDKGNPQGKDPNAPYVGTPGGGGGGFGLNMAGWDWDQPPQAPNIPDNRAGKIVFEIEVDADGEIIRIDRVEGTLSPEAEQLCRREIQKRSLVKTSGGAVPERSKGRVVFNLYVK